MKELEMRIKSDGEILEEEILKVDSFINHQIDTDLLERISDFFASSFDGVDKIVTIETGGIAFAVGTAIKMGNIPVVFAKKSGSKILDEERSCRAEVRSFTRGTISTIRIDRRFLKPGERCLIIDDFLAEGNACLGLISLIQQAGAEVCGVGAVIEKRFQGGREKIEYLGIKVISAAAIERFEGGRAVFCDDSLHVM